MCVYMYVCIYIYMYTLVVSTPPWKIWKSVGMIIPNLWENKKCSKPPTSIYSRENMIEPTIWGWNYGYYGGLRMELIYIWPTTYIVMSGGLPSRTGHLMKIPFELVAIPVQRNRCGEPKIPHFALEGPKLGASRNFCIPRIRQSSIMARFIHPP